MECRRARGRAYGQLPRTREKRRERDRTTRANNLEKFRERERERARIRYWKDPEKSRERVRVRLRSKRKENREKAREGNRRYRARNREKVRERARRYREKNREKVREVVRAAGHRRRARKRQNGVGKVDLKRLELEMPRCCFHPEGDPECRGRLEVEHLFPVAVQKLGATPGGAHAQFNLSRSCRSSNAGHGNRFRVPVVFTGPVQEAYVRLLVLILDALAEDERPAVRRWAERVRWRP